ncbi:IPT/TIG domain-containing protein [Polaribacter sp. KT25b]|uniref:IPT/TIG domain-containing protein n=1 Tax=Polaribacter sp. KT25b TaxID=1855336 RepID=UPI00087DBA93|nr:IPT/TIG domain-containing protein [Polaribacter sp. KT25b]SDR98087.1 IPT/TIG domain-containing protein [Polaribacter sp. KT25b]
MKIKNSLFLYLFIFLISCESNETVEIEKIPTATITSYSILDNNNIFIQTKTDLEFSDPQSNFLEEHGVYWYKNTGSKGKINLGSLQENQFIADISQGLLKDSIYKTYPYIKFQNKYFYGDTLTFKSNFTSMVKIDKVFPLNGFINDTITFEGKNFCAEDFSNTILLGTFSQLHIISESDTLIKAVVPSYLRESELSLTLKTCNTTTQIKDKFTINEPIIDSISSGEKFIGDVLTIYGENIHTSISEVWLENIKTELVYNNNSVDSVSIKVPKKLSVGKVALKMKVLDRIIEKPNYFETTTPYIESLLPQSVGFLDTLTIKGNYFIQKNSNLKVYVGNSLQKIVALKKGEIKILIDRYFNDTNPKVKLEFTDFTIEKPVQILPPTIEGFNKEIYHLNETDFTIKTESFLDDDIEIGGRPKTFGVKSEIDILGNVNLSLISWLNINFYSWNYNLTTPGSLEIKITTPFGEDSKLVKIHKPEIISVNKEEFKYNDHIILTGNNFAYRSFTKVFIDDEEVPFQANSAYTLNNSKIEFPLNINTTAGKHKLYVITAGQKSNEIEYSIKKTEVFSLSSNSGTRRDLYEITGKNLQKLDITADDFYVFQISEEDEKVTFMLPYFNKLKPSFKITASSGDQKFDLGTFNGIEPFDFYEQVYEDDVPYYKTHISFSDEENWFFCNNKGVYKFSFIKNKWELFDNNPPPFGTPIFGEKAYISLENGIAKYPIGSKVYLYDTNTKIWSEAALTNISVKNGVIVGDYLYGIQYNTNDFYKVNLLDNSVEKINKPSDLNILYENITYGDDKIFINPFQGSGYYYDIKTNNWVNMGRPRDFYGTYNNVSLKYYNGSLYFSGGYTDGGVEHRLYEYNISTNSWSEKNPMLQKLMNHVTYIKDDTMYFSLGIGQYYYINPYVQVYDIKNDPH